MSRRRREQLKALLDERWGKYEEGQPRAPKPASAADAVDEVMVCRLMALARKQWPDDYGTRPNLRLIHGGLST